MLDKCLNQISDGSPGIENRVPETTSQSTITMTAAQVAALFMAGANADLVWAEHFDRKGGPLRLDFLEREIRMIHRLFGLLEE